MIICQVRTCIECGRNYTYKESRGQQMCSKECANKHLAKIRFGEGNPRFNNGWRQYRTKFPEIKSCQDCGDTKHLELHHIDGNHRNNADSNLVKVCRRCHMLRDGRLANLNYYNSGTGLCAPRS